MRSSSSVSRTFAAAAFVAVEGQEGAVEYIGLRSTRIRTFYDSVVTIPNRKMVNSALDNWGRRRVRRLKRLFGLRYDSDPERIEAFVGGWSGETPGSARTTSTSTFTSSATRP